MPDGRGIDPALAPGGFAECSPTPAIHADLTQLKVCIIARGRCLGLFGLFWLCLGVLLFRGLPFRFLQLLAFHWFFALGTSTVDNGS